MDRNAIVKVMLEVVADGHSDEYKRRTVFEILDLIATEVERIDWDGKLNLDDGNEEEQAQHYIANSLRGSQC